MDPNLIPTLGGLVLFVSIWMATFIGRAYVHRLQAADDRDAEGPPSD